MMVHSRIPVSNTLCSPSVEDIDEYNTIFNEILDGMFGKFISIFDATEGKWLTPKGRIKFGECSKLNEEKYKDRFMINSIVIPNAIIKMMLKGVNLANKPKVPQKIFSKIDEAIKVAEEEIRSW